jgi:hypothetical protein
MAVTQNNCVYKLYAGLLKLKFYKTLLFSQQNGKFSANNKEGNVCTRLERAGRNHRIW